MSTGPRGNDSGSGKARDGQIRPFRTHTRSSQQYAQHAQHTNAGSDAVFNPAIHELNEEFDAQDKKKGPSKIRAQLKVWNDVYGQTAINDKYMDDVDERGETVNGFARTGDGDNFKRRQENEDNVRDELSMITQAGVDELDTFDPQHRFLRKGDMVELEFPHSERESVVAVFVRRVGGQTPQSQFYTVQGKWIHLSEKSVQYAIPNWVEPSLLDPIIPYLPDEEVTEELLERAQMTDLSVPRDVSAPLVSRMLDFQRTSEEVYRKNATTLDNAHDMLAHRSDLKFGNLEQIALRLLGEPDGGGPMPVTSLFAVRKALSRAGFAFGSDRRSHRMTGFIQIRSKEQVANVHNVRDWLRDWQDCIAAASKTRTKPNFVGPAKKVHDFISKACRLINESRKERQPTAAGRLEPSKERFPITDEQTALQYKYTTAFDDADRELIKFMEAWACANLFLGLPRIESLPPLILQATHKYDHFDLGQPTGFLFLQEIGVLLPHENRVRYDQHLLLPSSQHSRPLEKLMTALQKKAFKPDFVDSMAHLRHDWGSMPVFCIDDEGALEIDDGLSLEKVAGKDDEYWVHVHIANPTAFFAPDTPLAKMAQHMTETIYMPERAFVMLPAWATQRFFSLEKNRPCLTFSARMNLNGDMLEHKVQPGFIRNVTLLSPNEVSKVLGLDHGIRPDMTLRVGGDPPERPRKKLAESLGAEHIGMLKTMQTLAEKRQAKRKNAGGLFFDSQKPDISVWSSTRPGLPWDHPSRQCARRVSGEPIINYRSKEFSSWFSTGEGVADILVREMMLLACEIGATWCAERNVPVVYRGTLRQPDQQDPNVFFHDVLQPASEKNGGEAPMHLAIEYLRSTGATVLSTQPLHHRVLGLDHYAKVTSPLRRYGDMILHWQIEAALRHEHETKSSLIVAPHLRASSSLSLPTPEPPRGLRLPFSLNALTHINTALQPREAMIRRASRYAEDFWTAQLFFRAFHYNEASLPSRFSAYVPLRVARDAVEVPVIVKDWSLQCTMERPGVEGSLGSVGAGLPARRLRAVRAAAAKKGEDGAGSEAEEDVCAGDWWEVELCRVDCFYRKVVMRPVRLISRWEG